MKFGLSRRLTEGTAKGRRNYTLIFLSVSPSLPSQLGWRLVSAESWMKPPVKGDLPGSWRLWRKTTSRTTLCPLFLLQARPPGCLPSAKPKNQRRRRGRRGAITSNRDSGKTSPRCWRRRTCQRRLSLTTCLLWPHPPLYLPVTSAASVGFPLTTPVPPVGGATAAASV